LLHAVGIAGVIGFDVVPDRGTHGGRLIAGGLVVLGIGQKAEKQKR